MRKKLVFFLLLFLLLPSCITVEQGVVPLCRHRAIYCAITYADLKNVPVRIAYGKAYNESGKFIGYHCQAQAYIDGKWRWLDLVGNVVAVTNKNAWFEVEGYVSVDQAMIYWINIPVLPKTNRR